MRLFGTDGIRGQAGSYPLDPETLARLGAAIVRTMRKGQESLRLLSGRDTRESGGWIERALARGIDYEGGRLYSAGVIPTPAIAHLTSAKGFDAGVMISASHNSYEDNGIKVFSGRGHKFSEHHEQLVEGTLADPTWHVPHRPEQQIPQVDVTREYMDHVRTVFPDAGPLRGAKIALDCANGAMSLAAPRLMCELGLEITTRCTYPDGRNINRDCGSTHPEPLARLVTEEGARLGAAFDGDGDRAILVDHTGKVTDGDAVLLMCAKHLKATGRLRHDAIVATVMSNVGLEIALREAGIELVRCPVGDKYVMEEMRKRDLSLGGEQSGHIIFSDYLVTGDGLITALAVLRTMAETGRELSDLASELVPYPQILLNVKVARKREFRYVPELKKKIASIDGRLAGRGRLLVRYSGTEPLLRIMVEGQDPLEIRQFAEELADTARRVLA